MRKLFLVILSIFVVLSSLSFYDVIYAEEETKNPSDKIIKESPKKESGKKTPLKNSVKPKNKQKSKSNVNPFLVENTFENKKKNTKIKYQRNKNSKRSLYFINYNNEISDLKDQNSNKSVFSRKSKKM